MVSFWREDVAVPFAYFAFFACFVFPTPFPLHGVCTNRLIPSGFCPKLARRQRR
jgi:hypothetical protein